MYELIQKLTGVYGATGREGLVADTIEALHRMSPRRREMRSRRSLPNWAKKSRRAVSSAPQG